MPLQVIHTGEPEGLLGEQGEDREEWELYSWQLMLLQLVKWVWYSHHVSAGAGKRHVSGVKLQSVNGPWMFPVQHGHLHPTIGAPDMDSPVLWACTVRYSLTQSEQNGHPTMRHKILWCYFSFTYHNKLWIGSEAGLQGDASAVIVALQMSKNRKLSGI